jgi:hypothetical protein
MSDSIKQKWKEFDVEQAKKGTLSAYLKHVNRSYIFFEAIIKL